MAAAGLGRCLLRRIRVTNHLPLLASRTVTSQGIPRLSARCSVALTARSYSSNEGHYKFAKSHEWVRLDGSTATIGISEYAQDKLGDVVFVELPEVDSDLEKGDQLGTLESVKAVAEVYTAISGKVTEVNSELENSPHLINDDPHGNGWLAKLKVTNPEEELADLMTHEQYDQYIIEST